MGHLMQRLIVFTGLVLCYLFSLLAPLRWLWAVLANPARALAILKGYDLLGNTLSNGSAGEYISTRAYIAALHDKRWGIALMAVLDLIEPGHCRQSYEAELARAAALQATAHPA
jgi:hypothetical protein